MRLQIIKSKNAASFYVVKSFFENGKHSNKVIEKLGTEKDLTEKLRGRCPYEWAKAYVAELNRLDKEQRKEIIVRYSPVDIIDKNDQRLFNGGYLFLQKIYHELGLDKICNQITDKYKFTFDLNDILKKLIYGRVIFPSSKLNTFEESRSFIEPPNFELHNIYRGLEVIANEMDFIQSAVYKNSLKAIKRNTGVIYYDCTNYFFEIEQEEGLKQYGVSKEHRPNPIVQMGLFMDSDGIPLAFCINPGNQNEQTTLQPLEQKIIKDFGLSKFVVCTDAGLDSMANRKFNNLGQRAFITTQSVKKLKGFLREWALEKKGWLLFGDKKGQIFNLNEIDEALYSDSTFYKDRWINEDNLEQKLIITYSVKHKNYQQKIRMRQLERAEKLLSKNPKKLDIANQNSYKRLIKRTACTDDGEIAKQTVLSIDNEVFENETQYDGFYGVCTNLDDSPEKIVAVRQQLWQIEENFRIMKSELKSRPVFLRRDERIKAHFVTCFLSLLVYRILEKKLGDKFTCSDIIKTLKEHKFTKVYGEGYIPSFNRTVVTDALHDFFGFRTDTQIVTNSAMKKIISSTK